MNWIVEKEEFSQEETELILKGQSPDRLPSATLEKLKNLDLADQSPSTAFLVTCAPSFNGLY